MSMVLLGKLNPCPNCKIILTISGMLILFKLLTYSLLIFSNLNSSLNFIRLISILKDVSIIEELISYKEIFY